MSPDRDRVSLIAGTALALLGGVLCLDQLDLFSLSFGLAAALICAAAGSILVASGLAVPAEPQREGERDE